MMQPERLPGVWTFKQKTSAILIFKFEWIYSHRGAEAQRIDSKGKYFSALGAEKFLP